VFVFVRFVDSLLVDLFRVDRCIRLVMSNERMDGRYVDVATSGSDSGWRAVIAWGGVALFLGGIGSVCECAGKTGRGIACSLPDARGWGADGAAQALHKTPAAR